MQHVVLVQVSHGENDLPTPSAPVVQAPIGDRAVFFVSGGSGLPSAAVTSGPRPAAVLFKPEGGQARFEFSPPAGAVAGELYTLRFADGAGAVERLVDVQVTEPPMPAATKPPGPANSGDTANTSQLGSPASTAGLASAPSATATKLLLSATELQLLKQPASATKAQIDAAVQRCRASARDGLKIKTTGALDDALQALSLQPPGCSVE